MRVLLSTPPTGFSSKGPRPPLGLLSLAATLERPGVETDVLECRLLNVSRRRLLQKLRERRYDLVALTVLTENRFDAFAFAAAARRLLPDAWIILGGPHVSGCPEETAALVAAADAVVAGEGETILRLIAEARLEGRPLASVPGLYLRKTRAGDATPAPQPVSSPFGADLPKEVVLSAPPPPPETDLDHLPPPAWDKLPREATLFPLYVPGRGELPAASLVTSRGCPHRCSFCATARVHGTRVRTHGVARVKEEIARAEARGARALWFHDDLFTHDKERLTAICEHLAAAKKTLPWCCSARVEHLDRKRLRLMKRAGCFSIFFGVESGSERIRKLSGKAVPLELVREAARRLDEVGIRKNPGYIIGFPTETREEARETLRLMAELGGLPAPSFLRLYPGTEVERLAREKNVLPRNFRWSVPPKDGRLQRQCLFGQAPLCFDLLDRQDLMALALQWGGADGETGGGPSRTGGGIKRAARKVGRVLRSARRPSDFVFLGELGARSLWRKTFARRRGAGRGNGPPFK